MSWVIAGKKDAVPEVGKTYNISHSRKGNLVVKVLEVNGEWLTGELVSGKERLMSRTSMPTQPGESITLRDTHCYLAEAQP